MANLGHLLEALQASPELLDVPVRSFMLFLRILPDVIVHQHFAPNQRLLKGLMSPPLTAFFSCALNQPEPVVQLLWGVAVRLGLCDVMGPSLKTSIRRSFEQEGLRREIGKSHYLVYSVGS